MTENLDIDPELVDDRDNNETDDIVVDLPDYDPVQFLLPDGIEFGQEVEDGSEDED